ncbi:MAG TPA: serine hydrolase domain-containing protein [Thermomicrobiales bacterium]|jgi:D-alanyl-D-alanine carboxypeptidase|nr:serine hydrolase domain-containing protein [Thermomicrobiales bacterium]
MQSRISRRSVIAATSGLALASPLLSTAMAQEATPSSATPVASPVATPLPASLDDLLAATVEKGVPGIALAVERGGEVIYSDAAGFARMEDQTPAKPTDRFRIYSITKTFVATVVLQLVDEGLLSLDDTVSSLLDDPSVAKIANVDTATVRQLLNHTSGIYDYLDESDSPFYNDAWLAPNVDWSRVWTIDELLAYADAANHGPYFAPGKSGHYSNTGYLLLGMIVEAATGNTFADELGTRVLTPLSLKDTALEMGKALPEDVVDAYHVLEGELVNVSAINLTWTWTGGGMVSTTADLLRFADAVFSGELLSPASLDEMFTFYPDPSLGVEGFAWGMGIYRLPTPLGELSGMEGGAAGGTSFMMRIADAEVTVALLANMAPDDGTIRGTMMDAFAWTLANE